MERPLFYGHVIFLHYFLLFTSISFIDHWLIKFHSRLSLKQINQRKHSNPYKPIQHQLTHTSNMVYIKYSLCAAVFLASGVAGLPTQSPTASPSKAPSRSPTTSPSKSPSTRPTSSPSKSPTTSPSRKPLASPSSQSLSHPSSEQGIWLHVERFFVYTQRVNI
jgi:hypothetical protein